LEDYIFHEGTLPADFQIGFDQAIFNQPDHLALQSTVGWTSFFILHEKNKKAIAAVYFHLADGIAKSPLKNPFGSIEFSDSTPLPLLYDFVLFIEQKLRARNIREIVVKAPPQKYSPHAAIVNIFLLNNNYNVTHAKAGAVIEITEQPMKKILHRSERRRLAKAQKAELFFRQMPATSLNCVYKFIESCRDAKGYKLSLSLSDVQKTVEKFPDHYLMFGVFQNDTLAAASIAIRVQHNVLYEFYHDHHAEFNHLSPVVLLVEGIYRYCQSNGIALLDLGTSAADDAPNFGLLNFKLKLGAKPTPKLIFAKALV
jgi:hypothetical protein